MAQLHNNRLRLIVDGLTRVAQNGSDLLDAPLARRHLSRRAARAVIERVARPLTVRQAAFDRQIVGGIEELALSVDLAHRGASAFPGPLRSAAVTDVPTDVGRLYLHASDRVMTPFIRHVGYWELAETNFVRSRLGRGATFVDVGANVGYFSVLAASLVGPTGRVVSVEPEHMNLELLRANLWRNGASNAVVLPIAAHRRNDFLPLRLGNDNRGAHEVGWAGDSSLLVPCARLDDLLGGMEIDLIKIDAQATDHDAIAGLSRVLTSTHAPEVICEFWVGGMYARGVDPWRVAAGYEELGFTLELLDEQAQLHRVTPDALVRAAEAAGGRRFVNVVLRSRDLLV